MELGFYTFADVMSSPETGKTISPAQRLHNLIEEIELADQVGLDVFGIGEHHRPEYAASAPVIVLAAAAERTRNIRLTSAVTVLSSDDPVRVFQNFAIEKILLQHKIFGHQRFLMQSSVGAMPHRNIMHAIELFGTKVAPVVRRETAGEAPTPKEPSMDSLL